MIRIGGLQKLSLIDYPGKLSAVIFTQGCPFRCLYCHNPSLVIPEKFTAPIGEEELFGFLKSRRGKLEGVVISGGEPALQQGLCEFLSRIKELGFAIKLDTSGILPDVISDLLAKKLLDYIAMDIKAPFSRYEKVTAQGADIGAIRKSIEILKSAAPDYEFRSTLVPSLHSLEDVEEMAKMIEGAKRYVLQNFQPKVTLDPALKQKNFSLEQMELYRQTAAKYTRICSIR